MPRNAVVLALALALTPAVATAAADKPLTVQVDGRNVLQAVMLDGAAYVEVGALAAAAGLRHEHDWKVDGTRLLIETAPRDREAKITVQATGIVSRNVRAANGSYYIPADDVARALGGHAHVDARAGVVHISVGSTCSVCRLAPQLPVNSSL